MEKLLTVKDFNQYQARLKTDYLQKRHTVMICMTGCRAYGAGDLLAAVKEQVKIRNMEAEVEVRSTGCHGFCARAPVLAIEPMGIQYQEVTPDDAADIVVCDQEGAAHQPITKQKLCALVLLARQDLHERGCRRWLRRHYRQDR